MSGGLGGGGPRKTTVGFARLKQGVESSLVSLDLYLNECLVYGEANSSQETTGSGGQRGQLVVVPNKLLLKAGAIIWTLSRD